MRSGNILPRDKAAATYQILHRNERGRGNDTCLNGPYHDNGPKDLEGDGKTKSVPIESRCFYKAQPIC